ncbi:uncharacterized protein LOC143803713 [Ranitomeya variabilis]|uniref:uncharacterized protein LOC143803713 n=1 Tax=Ranitomeya variabilis TaxID=490064 RepID=UPI004057044D
MSIKGTVDPSASEAHQVPDTIDAAGAEPTLTTEQDVRPRRVTKPTQKVRENFETTRDEFHDNLEHLWGRVDHYLAALPRYHSDAAGLTATLKSLSAAYDHYQRLSVKYITFLSNCVMEDAPAELTERETLLQEKTSLVRDAQDKAELRIAHLQEVRSHRTTSTKITARSSRSSHSRKSTLSNKLLEIQREEATALAKLKVLEQALGQDDNSDCLIPEEMEDAADRTTDYVLRHSTSAPAPPPVSNTDVPASQEMSPPTADKVTSSTNPQFRQQPTEPLETKPQFNPYAASFRPDLSQSYKPENLHSLRIPQVHPATMTGRSDMSDFARYMIRRELINISLSKFDDRAENYRAWKSTFQAVIQDLNLTGKEQLDLLVNWLGPESAERIKTIRAVHVDYSDAARPKFFEIFNIKGQTTPYTLNTCSGRIQTSGRRASGYIVSSIKGNVHIPLPTIIECDQIPDNREEIPTPEAALHHRHLRHLTNEIPPLDMNADILILLGRDILKVHKVRQQCNGPDDAPYAQRLDLGWVIVGDVCLDRSHKASEVNACKTYVLQNGRATHFKPCLHHYEVKERFSDCIQEPDIIPTPYGDDLGRTVFHTTKDDNKVALSIEDKEFLKIMDSGFFKNESDRWVAPLPFKASRTRLPNNREQALSRFISLQRTLKNKPEMKEHFIAFMDKIFRNDHAEPAPPLQADEECWYLPSFGVYHPRKPKQIRVVFDSSAKHDGVSLNDVLLTGPNLTNNLVGVLMRFRKEPVAITADIEQMFHCFIVQQDHRNYLRFLWHRDNDTNKEMIEYRMKVHVFGNSPSPAVATYGLRRTASDGAAEFGNDAQQFVEKDFYMDDGLKSMPTAEEAIDLLKRTQGPEFLHEQCEETAVEDSFSLQDPDVDPEIRPDVSISTFITKFKEKVGLDCRRFDRFSRWTRLVRAIARLVHIVQCYRNKDSNTDCHGWHICHKPLSAKDIALSELIVIHNVQQNVFSQGTSTFGLQMGWRQFGLARLLQSEDGLSVGLLQELVIDICLSCYTICYCCIACIVFILQVEVSLHALLVNTPNSRLMV